jgi:hypothetical protein
MLFLTNFQPFNTCPLLHPCPTLPPRYSPVWQIFLQVGLFEPTLRAGSHRLRSSRTRACRYAAGVAVVTPSASPLLSLVASLSLCSWHGSTRTGLPHAPSGSRPRLGTCPATAQRSRSESVVTLPCSRLAVTSPCYCTFPGHVPISPHAICTR